MPILSLLIDILTELLYDSDSWIVKDPVVRLLKVISGHWEREIEKELVQLDWDKILGNLIRLFRLSVFQCSSKETIQVDLNDSKRILEYEIRKFLPRKKQRNERLCREKKKQKTNLFFFFPLSGSRLDKRNIITLRRITSRIRIREFFSTF